MLWSFPGKIIATLLVALLLTSCGGGGGSGTDANIQSDPVGSTPTDSAPLKISTGAITGFGGVFVNGVEYETDAAEIVMNDNTQAGESDLHIGMVITIQGEIHEAGMTGEAHNIHYSENVIRQPDGMLIARDLVALVEDRLSEFGNAIRNSLESILFMGLICSRKLHFCAVMPSVGCPTVA